MLVLKISRGLAEYSTLCVSCQSEITNWNALPYPQLYCKPETGPLNQDISI